MATQASDKAPRDGHVSIDGTPWLARMIDKARLERTGEIVQFDLDFPCPMDRQLLSKLGIDAKQFQEIAVTSPDDASIVKALKVAGASL
ncbi:MAG: DUF5069 domain-containing protein [Cyanobacteria bacterium P01_H01_bin.74]